MTAEGWMALLRLEITPKEGFQVYTHLIRSEGEMDDEMNGGVDAAESILMQMVFLTAVVVISESKSGRLNVN